MIISNGSPVLGSQIDTIADSTPIFADASYYPSTSLSLLGTWAAYGALYRQQLWVGIVVRKLAAGTARLPFDVKRQGAGTNQAPEPGALADLMARPNERLSGLKLWLWTSSTYDIYGEAFWLKIRDSRGIVRELHPMHPTNVIVRRNPDTGEMFYVYAAGVRNVSLLPEQDVVAFTNYNPDNLQRGLSNLESLRSTLLNEDAARRATASWWQRGARPSVALKHPGELSAGAQQRLRANWESHHSGADLMGGTAILEEGMEAQVIQLSAEEMQYIESRKLNREEVCSAYDVPPPVVHILDHATFSNITEQMRSQYRDTQTPRLGMFESVVDHQLVPDFYPDRDVFTRFNMDEVLRGDFESRATAVGSLIERGVLMPSEARPMFGLAEAGPEAAVLYGNAALVPLGSSVHGQQEVDPSGNLIPSPLPMGSPKPPPPAPSKAVRYDQRSMLRRVGNVKAVGGDVRAALVEEHRKALADLFEVQRASAKAQTKALGSGWDDDLAVLLEDLGTATAKALGSTVAKALGGSYDVGDVADWIHENSIASAAAINETTIEALKAALDDNPDDPEASVDEVFDGSVSQRVGAIAAARVVMVGGLASLSSAGQNGAATKTWNAGRNARPSHAQMSGETVGIDDLFSNGMNMPGDPAGGADEVAGCNCDVSFDF